MGAITYLAKDGPDLVCHCECSEALITFPPQMDCPWCGCGWLFTCIECRKAFTFARGMPVRESWQDLAQRDLTNRGGGKQPVLGARNACTNQAFVRRLSDGFEQVIIDLKTGRGAMWPHWHPGVRKHE